MRYPAQVVMTMDQIILTELYQPSSSSERKIVYTVSLNLGTNGRDAYVRWQGIIII